ncbi:MAG: 2-C-methyl-D-erythritol 4-phosphate cytidylyltransferase [candidate division Zixibacteria bacterium]|nr:2-C-methyl-D-erythritol 4-phosphate cytidylyltransferase [candidate division Zixibacteria bacterium]
MMTCAIIVAAGSASRFGGGVPKQLREVCGRPLLSWTVSRFEAAARIDHIVVVVAEEHLLYVSQKVIDPYAFAKVTKILIGGQTRSESVLKGLKALPLSTSHVAIHDGVRPLVRPDDIDRVVETAIEERAAMLAVPATDTVKRVEGGFVLATLDRDRLHLAQTPQAFQYDLIVEAYRQAAEANDPAIFTDDASLIEAKGFKVRVVEPSGPNIKVTTPDDLVLVEALLRRESDDIS